MSRRRLFSGMQVFTTGLSITLLLILLGTTVFFVLAAGNLSREVKQNLVVTALLDDEVSENDGQRLCDILGTKPYAFQSTYISKAQALAEEKEAMGLNPTEFLDANPFNASIEIRLAADYVCTDSILKITQELKARGEVTDVLCQRDLVERVTDILQRAGYMLLGLAALLTVISFTLINNTVRLSIHSRRHLIYTMRLVGASFGFIRRPFVLNSMCLGLVSGILSTALIVFAVKTLAEYESSLHYLAPDVTLYIVAGVVMAAGLLLTLVCSFLTVSRYLHMHHNELY